MPLSEIARKHGVPEVVARAAYISASEFARRGAPSRPGASGSSWAGSATR